FDSVSPSLVMVIPGWKRLTEWSAESLMTCVKPSGLACSVTVVGNGSASPGWTVRVALIVHTSPKLKPSVSAVLEVTYGLAGSSKIGRGSCRERVVIRVGAVSVKRVGTGVG